MCGVDDAHMWYEGEAVPDLSWMPASDPWLGTPQTIGILRRWVLFATSQVGGNREDEPLIEFCTGIFMALAATLLALSALYLLYLFIAGLIGRTWNAMIHWLTREDRAGQSKDTAFETLRKPWTAEQIFTFVNGEGARNAIQLARSPTLFPAAATHMYCKECAATARLILPTPFMNSILDSHVKELKDLAGSEEGHRCPIGWERGSLMLIAYWIRRAENLAEVERIQAPVVTDKPKADARLERWVASGSCREGPRRPGAARAKKGKKGKKEPKKIQSGSADVFLGPQGPQTNEERVEQVRDNMSRIRSEQAELAAYRGDGRGDDTVANDLEMAYRHQRNLLNTLLDPNAEKTRQNVQAVHQWQAAREEQGEAATSSWADLMDDSDDDDYYQDGWDDDDDAGEPEREAVTAEMVEAAKLAAEAKLRADDLKKTLMERFKELEKVRHEATEEYSRYIKSCVDNLKSSPDRPLALKVCNMTLGSWEERQFTPAVTEGPLPSIVVCDDEKFSIIAIDELPEVRQQFEALSVNLIQEHAEVVARTQAAYDEREMDRARLESQLGAPKAVPSIVAALVTPDGVRRGACVFSHSNGEVLLATHRHGLNEVDAPIPSGTPISVVFLVENPLVGHTRNLRWHEATVRSAVANEGEDQQWLFLDIPVPEVVKCGKTAVPAMNQTVTQYALRVTGDSYSWDSDSGKVTLVNEKYVCYDLSTDFGDCGYPVMRGSVPIAMHLYGKVRDAANNVANGGELLKRPPKPADGVNIFPEYKDPPVNCEITRGVRQGPPDPLCCRQRFRMMERMRLKGLRTDKSLVGLLPRHYWMKPSTEMNKEEVLKFLEPLGVALEAERLRKSMMATIMYDCMSNVRTQFVEPDIHILRSIASSTKLMPLDKNAGNTADNKKYGEYLLHLGDGNMEAGVEAIAHRCLRLYKVMCSPNPLTHEDHALYEEARFWTVLGKRDGYKEKKLPPQGSGRTIQAPCAELKILHLAAFGENDEAWLNRAGHRGDEWVHQGEDADLPCSGRKKLMLMKALSSLAADVTGYDRRMADLLMVAYFTMYLPTMCVGVPLAFCKSMGDFTIFSALVLSNGEVVMKAWGNPSGYMNTLRLNCVTHLLSMFYVYFSRNPKKTIEEAVDFFDKQLIVEICGDDSRLFAMTREAHEYLDAEHDGAAYIKAWSVLPWEVKLEGACVYPQWQTLQQRCLVTPPMVSRRFVLIDGVLWEPLVNLSRCLKRLSCGEDRTQPGIEQALIGSAFGSLALHVSWTVRRNQAFYSPAVEYLLREYGTPALIAQCHGRAAELRESALMRQQVLPVEDRWGAILGEPCTSYHKEGMALLHRGTEFLAEQLRERRS
jgi:hypothetical protein